LHDIRSNLSEIHSQNELAAWSKLDKDISLSPADGTMKDDIYTIYRFSERHHEQEPYREIAGTITVEGKPYKLVISSSLIENDDLLGSILLVQTVLLISLIGGMLWINQRTSKKLWQPFYTALKNMQQFELNRQTDLLFSQSTTDEFNELNKAIKNLFSRNYEIFQQQKEFTENASHEMQTPLAIFQSKLELLMQTSPVNNEQAELIGDLANVSQRMGRLNKSLILLTRIENLQFAGTESISLAVVIEKNLVQFHLFQLLISSEYTRNDRITRSSPVVTSTKGLVHSFLLIGNTMFQHRAKNINRQPASSSLLMVSYPLPFSWINLPA